MENELKLSRRDMVKYSIGGLFGVGGVGDIAYNIIKDVRTENRVTQEMTQEGKVWDRDAIQKAENTLGMSYKYRANNIDQEKQALETMAKKGDLDNELRRRKYAKGASTGPRLVADLASILIGTAVVGS